jgi:serine/threonine protein kinase
LGQVAVELVIRGARPIVIRYLSFSVLLSPTQIISLYELSLFTPKTELYMMMELMDCDLHRVIQSKQALSEKHHKCFLKQMLEGIKAMHSIGVFHRDLKPGNILVSKDCQLRITDFGLARFMDASTRKGENELSPMTQYVVTRWYRPPELLLAPNLPYGEPVDLWSIGCILAELLRRKPLFPGKSHLNQAQLIFELKGYTNSRELGFPVSAEAASFLDKKCRYRKQSIRKYVPDASESAINLLEQLLAVNPRERPTAEQALQHPFLADAEVLHDYSKTYLTRPSPEYFEFEHTAFTVPELRAMIEHEVEISAADAYRYSARSNSPAGVKRRGEWQSRGDGDGISPTTTNEDHSARGNVPGKVAGGAVPPAAEQGKSASANPFNNNKPNLRRTSRTGEDQMMQDGNGEGEEGPPSQMPTPTQQRGANNVVQAVPARSEKSSTSSNPFRNQQAAPLAAAAPVKDRPKSSEEIGQAAAAYRGALLSSRSERDLQTDAADVIPVSAIPAGNILTAMRNEAHPGHIPVGSRTKTPKTPSPKKMDQILQKDMLNKRRFLMQQQQQQADIEAAGAAAAVAAQGPSYATRSNRYSLSNGAGSNMQDVLGGGAVNVNAGGHVRSQSAASDYSQQAAAAAQQQQMSRFGKLIPAAGVPFPTIASRMTNISNRLSGAGGGGKKAPTSGGNGVAEGSAGGAAGAAQMNMHHSNTILHSGSNIINSSEYPSNQY